MYIVPSFLDPDFTGIDWQTPAHREVAEHTLLCNPRITTKDHLVECCKIINAVPEDQIKSWTVAQAHEAGLPV